MKRIFTRVLIPIFISVISGFICGKIIYQIYDTKMDKDVSEEEVYLVQAGEYRTYDEMVNDTSESDYVYYEDDGLFKSIVGITENKNNIEKIKNFYGKELVVNKCYSDDADFNKTIKSYDNKLKKTDNNDEIKKTIIEMIGLYKGDNKKTLVKIS